jgi:hypothetical protein
VTWDVRSAQALRSVRSGGSNRSSAAGSVVAETARIVEVATLFKRRLVRALVPRIRVGPNTTDIRNICLPGRRGGSPPRSARPLREGVADQVISSSRFVPSAMPGSSCRATTNVAPRNSWIGSSASRATTWYWVGMSSQRASMNRNSASPTSTC